MLLMKIQIHEIGYLECPKSYVFRGTKEYTAKQIQDMLGLLAPSLRPQYPAGQPSQAQAQARPYGASTRFLLPLAQCEFQLTTTIEQLQKDPWPVANDRRPTRCTGAALGIAVGLMESSFPNAGARLMVYSGGPCTEGPGMVVGSELKEPIRSHHDIERDNAKYYRKASKVC
jgi:protein transport protein SEC23